MAPVTDDLYRYRWEAMLQSQGGNPYQVRPADPEWAALRDATFPKVGQKDVKAGYGPAWELLARTFYEWLSHAVPDPFRQVFWFKLPGAVFDAATLGALCVLLRARRLPLERVLLYAWSPLPLWEFWANGHNDSVAVWVVVLGLAAAVKGRWRAAFACLGLATAVKFWPVLLVPAFVRESRRPWLALLVPVAVAVFGIAYWSGVTENLQFMTGFVGSWRNNDSLFALIFWLAGEPYRAKYVAWALVFLSALCLSLWPRTASLEQRTMWTIVAALLLSSNCHPWYLTWFAPLLAITPNAGLLLWTALMPLAYEVWIRWSVLGEWNGSTANRWFIYLPFFAVLLFSWYHHSHIARAES